jgi:hypothetical protein
MTPRILLATTVTWPGPARLAAAFSAAGCVLDAWCPRSHPLRASRFLGRLFAHDPHSAVASLRGAVERSEPDLVVPCDDVAVSHLLAVHASAGEQAIASLVERSLGSLRSYPVMMNRSAFIGAARDLGAAAPETVAVDDAQAFEAALARWTFPLVIKRDRTTGGEGVRIARSSAEVRSLVRRWASLRSSVSLQKFVSGHPATTAFAAWQGQVLATIHADVLETERVNGPSCVVRRVESAEMTRMAGLIAAHFGLSGLHGLDYLRARDGTLQLLEINPRATALCTLAFGPGHDLPAALAGALAGHAISARAPAIGGDLVAFYPQEWIRDPGSRYLRSAFHDIPRDDPGVQRILARRARWSRLRRRMRESLDRGLRLMGAAPVHGGQVADPLP